jgi:predicted permease
VSIWAHEKDPRAETQVLTGLLDRARAIPGVRNATLAWQVFGSAANCQTTDALGREHMVGRNVVEPNYFDVMRIPIVVGSGFAAKAALTDQPDAIVNQTLAHEWWPNENPLGKTLELPGCGGKLLKIGRVIGVARDAVYGWFGDGPQPHYYLSRLQDSGNGYFALVIRTAGRPYEWAKPLLDVARTGGPNFQVFEVKSVEDAVGEALWEAKWEASLLGAIGLLAIVLAAIGLYGVVAYAVSQRTREIGVRMALGAMSGDVQWLVLGHALRITAIGVACGLALSAATVRLLRGFLYGLSPFDPVAFTAASLAWIAIAMLASWLPARRATKVDPLTALKYE